MIYRIDKTSKAHEVVASMPDFSDGHYYVKADADGWIPWDSKPGAECPLSESAKCDAWVWKGSAGEAMIVSGYRAADLLREHGARNIIAYRPILDAEPPARRSVEQITDEGCRAMAEMSRQAQGEAEAPEWDGESWPPPIGAIVESTLRCFTGNACEVLAVRRGNVIACDVKTSVAGWIIESETRPLRTPAQRAEEAMFDLFNQHAEITPGKARTLAVWASRAIRDGKIPGVKLEGE